MVLDTQRNYTCPHALHKNECEWWNQTLEEGDGPVQLLDNNG